MFFKTLASREVSRRLPFYARGFARRLQEAKMKTPKELRLENRQNKNFKKSSNFGSSCPSLLQANIAIIPAEYADDFQRFCNLNSAACPTLYRSKPGEFTADLLATDSDIRTDVAAYKVFKNGALDKIASDLLEYNLHDMVTFYFGCSFTFEHLLISNGIRIQNVEEGKNVSMFTTNIQCHSVGPFSSPMVVSTRPVPRPKLDTILECCRQCDFCHGGPIHIGNPKEIGIEDLSKVAFGDKSEWKENEVPVFWACGVTSSLALSGARLPISFSHHPGCMFLADIDMEKAQEIFAAPLYPKSKVICLNESTQTYNVLSESAFTAISKIERELAADPGDRGISALMVEGDLLKGTLSLSQSAKAVCLVTGFPCFDDEPREENDGIAGTVALLRALQAISSSVTLCVDGRALTLFHQILHWCHAQGLLRHEVSVITVPKGVSAKETLTDSVTGESRFSHLVAIERPGRSKSEKYCTMAGKDVGDVADPLDELFLEAANHEHIVTIGVGDGGNEIGMGKVLDQVRELIPMGDEIGAVVPTDFLITCGVSNWGGYGLAGALYSAVSCSVHERYRRRGIGLPFFPAINDFLTTKAQETELQKFLLSLGVRDGITKSLGMTVDGLDFDKYHCAKLDAIRQICETL